MRLTIQLKLQPTPEQAERLRQTLETANAACDMMSRVAWETGTFRQFALHKLIYRDVRVAFGLSAQMAVRCIAKVADAYKLERETQRMFKPLGAVAFDDRILSYKAAAVSIWTLGGRQTIPFVCGERQRTMLQTQKGETDLVYRHGAWYLFTTCEIVEAAAKPAQNVLGVDLGVTNIATDSDGRIHSGKAIKNVRYRHRRLRTKLQTKGTKGSRRRLRQLAGQERRFATWVNHNLSKEIVAKAEGTQRGIALEDLKAIRTRITARRSQRATLHSWAFYQLRCFISYKAQLLGVPVHFVDPRNTSRTCPQCGCIDKNNRKTQASFICTSCGFAGPADVIAAGNIARRAVVDQPHCSEAAIAVAPGQSRRL